MRGVNLDELLSHQSGLPSNISGAKWTGFFKERQSPVLARRRMLKLVLSQPPAETQRKFAYSNLGYVVAPAMLETRAKEPFESLAKKHLFDPLEMDSADFRSMKSARTMKPPFLWGHDEVGKPMDPRLAGAENPTVYPSCGTVQIAIEDDAEYAHWQLKGEPPVCERKLPSTTSASHRSLRRFGSKVCPRVDLPENCLVRCCSTLAATPRRWH